MSRAPPVDLEWPAEEHTPCHPTWRAPLVAVLSGVAVFELAALAIVWWPVLAPFVGDPLGFLALVVVAYVFLAPVLDAVEGWLNRGGRSLVRRGGRAGWCCVVAARCLERAGRHGRLERMIRREAAGWVREAIEELGS